jgi:hypothetical protein
MVPPASKLFSREVVDLALRLFAFQLSAASQKQHLCTVAASSFTHASPRISVVFSTSIIPIDSESITLAIAGNDAFAVLSMRSHFTHRFSSPSKQFEQQIWHTSQQPSTRSSPSQRRPCPYSLQESHIGLGDGCRGSDLPAITTTKSIDHGSAAWF